MFCTKCGTEIYEGDKFCIKCGAPIQQERLCSHCHAKLRDNAIFCAQCGTKVGEVPTGSPSTAYTQQAPGPQTPPSNYQAPGHQSGPGAVPTGFHSQQPQKYHMISKYIGEPTAGIAKATGTLTVYPDHLEYTKLLGNALGGGFGLAGMAVAAKKAQQDGKVEHYSFQDIQTAYVGKYMAVMPAVVLVFNDGQVLSFNGSFTNQSASNIVNTILYYKSSN